MTTPVTDAALAELARLEAAVSAGPWGAWSGAGAGGGEYVSTGTGYSFGVSPGTSDGEGWRQARHDAEFCAAARNTLPALILELAARRAADAGRSEP